MIEVAERVIWSAEVPEERLDRILASRPPVRYVKLDRHGLTLMHLKKIAEVQERGFQVFADAKITGIPREVVDLTRDHLKYKPWMLNCMAGSVSTGLTEAPNPEKVDALKRFADLCRNAGTRPCAVTVLTSKTVEMVQGEFYGRTPNAQVLFYVNLLSDMGFTDVVCSPEEARYIRAYPDFDHLAINTPGVRLPGSDVRDQARTSTPAAALRAGATRVVIGSDLSTGNDFNANFARIAAHLNS